MAEGRRAARRSTHIPPRRKKPSPVWVLLIVAPLVLAGVGISAVLYLQSSFSTSFDEAEVLSEPFPDEEGRPAPGPAGTATFLLLGSDTRDGLPDALEDIEGNRSDAMIVARINAERDHIALMSVMRDSWVEIPSRGNNKINAAMSIGGVRLAVQTVEQLLDTRIDHVVVIDFEGFSALTDELGGVTVVNERGFSPSELPDAYFPAGEIELNGEESLAYVRDRMSFSDGDFQRVRNQQAFLRGVANGLIEEISLTNPSRVVDLVDSLTPYMQRDAGLTSQVIAGVAGSLSEIEAENIKSFTIPTLGTGTVSGQSVVVLDDEELAVVKKHFEQDSLDVYIGQ